MGSKEIGNRDVRGAVCLSRLLKLRYIFLSLAVFGAAVLLSWSQSGLDLPKMLSSFLSESNIEIIMLVLIAADIVLLFFARMEFASMTAWGKTLHIACYVFIAAVFIVCLDERLFNLRVHYSWLSRALYYSPYWSVPVIAAAFSVMTFIKKPAK